MSIPRLELTPDDWKDLDGGLDREWLLTNGLGGFASASIFGANTRRYHAILDAAEKVPTGRVVLLSKLEEELVINGKVYQLGVNEWSKEFVDPRGDHYLRRVVLDYASIEFHYTLDDYSLVKIVWMSYGQNSTYVKYVLDGPLRGDNIELHIRPFITFKDHHLEAKGSPDRPFQSELLPDGSGFVYRKNADFPELCLQFEKGQDWKAEQWGFWYWNFYHRAEEERGLDYLEDLFVPHTFSIKLRPGEGAGLVASLGPASELDFMKARQAQEQRMKKLVEDWSGEKGGKVKNATACLVGAADQFIVARPSVENVLPPGTRGKTVIAGYPWFTDWGRDTMIALPGLTLCTGRYRESASILRTFAAYLDKGMLPNRFPDVGEEPEYNTVDATLWFFQAVYAYFQATGDAALVADLFPKLEEVVQWHLKGTRYGIQVDPDDGLLKAGEPGVQLTWMDVKIDDWVVTPRWGKAVEINALWCNALGVMDYLRARPPRMAENGPDYAGLQKRATESFRQKFWYAGGSYLYDVIDTTVPPDPSIDEQKRDFSLRPNQLFAISLPFGPYSNLEDAEIKERAAGVLEICERELLTPYGMRTLNRADPRYMGRFTGGRESRDAAYHNGTVWPWLIGAFVEAHFRLHGDSQKALAFLEPLLEDLKRGGVGTLNEVYDGDAPHRPLGCFAQAWSVSEVLRLLQTLGGQVAGS